MVCPICNHETKVFKCENCNRSFQLEPEHTESHQHTRVKAENKPNNWTVAVVRSFDEYLAELHKLYVGNPDATTQND